MKYDLYGIGNALVDMEYQVSNDKLAELGVDKGLMTLIEEDRHHELVDQLSDLDHKKASGGSAANTVIATAQLGGKSFYSCKVSSDDFGDFYLKDMQACGVDTNLDGQTRVEYVYMEGYLVASPTGKAAAIKAAATANQASVPTVLTLSDPNMVEFFGDGLMEMAGDNLDLLFCNDDEAAMMTKTDSPEKAAEALKKIARRFAITVGADGSLIYDGESMHKIPAPTVDVIDTNGAGDMYAGAFLYGLTHDMSFVESATLASNAASKIVTHFGPRLPAEQTRALLG